MWPKTFRPLQITGQFGLMNLEWISICCLSLGLQCKFRCKLLCKQVCKFVSGAQLRSEFRWSLKSVLCQIPFPDGQQLGRLMEGGRGGGGSKLVTVFCPLSFFLFLSTNCVVHLPCVVLLLCVAILSPLYVVHLQGICITYLVIYYVSRVFYTQSIFFSLTMNHSVSMYCSPTVYFLTSVCRPLIMCRLYNVM